MNRIHVGRVARALDRTVALGLGIVCMAFIRAATAGSPADPCLPDEAVPDQVVVRLADGATIEEVLAAIEDDFPGITIAAAAPQMNAWLLSAPDPICEIDLASALLRLPGVDDAELNEAGQISEGQSQSFFFSARFNDFTNQYAWPLLGLRPAGGVSLGDGVTVAIVDTGLDALHPDFADATILPGIDLVGDGLGLADLGDGIDNDGDGFVDEMVGHGTFMAGVIHAIAPHAKLLPLRAIDTDGHGDAFTIAAAVLAAIDAGADVINLGFSSATDTSLLSDALDDAMSAGIIVVCAAGNGGMVNEPPFPAELGSVLAVAATDAADGKAPWSDCGAFVDLCAPGVAVVSAMPAAGYAVGDGTSMAAAMVTGGVALVRSHEPTLTRAQVIAKIEATAKPIDALNAGFAGQLGAGRLDLAAAVGAMPRSADLNGDGAVDGADLGLMLAAWGTSAADLTGDQSTDGADLGVLLAAWTG